MQLFVQALNAENEIRFSKVAGSENPADLCTKGLTADRTAEHVWTAGGEFQEGRPSACPKLMGAGGVDRAAGDITASADQADDPRQGAVASETRSI